MIKTMATVNEHYRQLLAKHYTWMFGVSFDDKVAEQQALLSQWLIPLEASTANALAVDLGAGPGFQTLALAALGYSPVIAIDTSAELLGELAQHAIGLPVQIENADLLGLPSMVAPGSAAAIVCMGDTVTHLPSAEAVHSLVAAVFEALQHGGQFVLTWRDLTAELHGADRFIPVRSDDQAIMTCFLEYQNATTVLVHDLVYTRGPNGWTMNKSSYPKLRLGLNWLLEELARAGFSIVSSGPAGRLSHIVAVRP